MPQNWWDIYPEVLPSPAARQFPLPGPGGVVPGSGMGLAAALGLGPDPLYGAPRLGQALGGGFDPSFLAGAPMLGQFAGGPPDQAPPIGYPQPPFAGDQTGPLSDRRLAVQQAAAAIRDGADPRAVRARLNQVGTDNPGFDLLDLFSDLLPGAGQVPDMMNQPQGPQPDPLSGGQPPFARDTMPGGYGPSGLAGGVAAQMATSPDPSNLQLPRGLFGSEGASLDRTGSFAGPQSGLDQRFYAAGYAQNPSDALPADELGVGFNGNGYSPAGSVSDAQARQQQAQPAFADQGGFTPPAARAGFASDPLRRLPPRLDPRLAPQKADFLQKSSPQKAGAGQATLSTYGLPSFPVDQSAGTNSTRSIPGGPNQGTGRVAARTSLPPPAPSGLTPWQLRRRQQNEMLLSNPRIRAFLDMISHSEGDTNYRSLFGNHHETFTDQSTHPGNHGQNYRGRPGGAAGRYQIMPVTYRNLNKLLGPYTMSDHDQDLMAVELIREGNALVPLVSGAQPDLATAVSRLGQRRTWTSFPVLGNGSWQSNPSGQPTRNFEELQRSFSGALDQARRRLGYH